MQKTTTQSDILQARSQTIAQTLDKQVIVATQGKQQHVKVKSGYLYEISLKEGEVLNADANLIVKKTGNSLEVLLEHNTAVIFDGYLAMCATDLSCLLSLPSAQGAYYVAENSFTPTANGSQIVYFYGDETALLDIAKGQSGSFEQSFSEVFLSSNDASALVDFIPLAFLGGGGGGGDDKQLVVPHSEIAFLGGGGGGSDDTRSVNQDDYFNPLTANYLPPTDNTKPGRDRTMDEVLTPDSSPTDNTKPGRDRTRAAGTGGEDSDVNKAPVASDINEQSVDENTNFNLPVASHFSVPDSDDLTYSATLANGNPLPTWLSFDATTATFSGKAPEVSTNKTITVLVTASDGALSDSSAFVITVNDVNKAPVATNISGQSVDENTNFHLPVASHFSDPDGDTLTYSATLEGGASLPTWLSFDATTATFSGTAPEVNTNETITVVVTASDESGLSVSNGFSINVLDTTAPRIINITSNPTLDTLDGRYDIGDEINISVEVDSEMKSGSQIGIILNNNQIVYLTRHHTDTNIYTDIGTSIYRVPSKSLCNSNDSLKVERVFFLNPETPATDLAGNILILDIPDDNNLDNNSALTIMNVVIGTNGHDNLSACNNIDTRMYGNNGNDKLYGKGGNDDLYGKVGSDKLYGGAGHDALWGGVGNDALYGQNGNDHLVGSDGNDKLYGGDGSDTIYGGRGNDTLAGGDGENTLTGDAGDDTFYYDRYQTSNDTITDFQVGRDRISITDIMIKNPGDNLDMGMFYKLMHGKIVNIADDNGTDTTINIDTNLDGVYNEHDVTITLENVSGYDLSDMITGAYILYYF